MVRHSFKRQITSFFLLGPHELVPVCEYSDALTRRTRSGGVSSGMIGGVSGGVSDGLSGGIKDSVEGFSLIACRGSGTGVVTDLARGTSIQRPAKPRLLHGYADATAGLRSNSSRFGVDRKSVRRKPMAYLG